MCRIIPRAIDAQEVGAMKLPEGVTKLFTTGRELSTTAV
jgi:hypothetical protein